MGIIGANGAGKSTLLHLMLGLLAPQAGQIRFDGVPLSKKMQKQIRERVGLVFQDPDDQLFMPSLGEDTAFGPRNQGLSETEVQERVAWALATVGLGEKADRPAWQLSGGEKKAASLATVLALQPDVLVFDEPTSSLDPRTRRQVMRLCLQLPQTRIITSHDLDLVLDICERTILLDHGRILADGPSWQILTNEPLLLASGLELPLRLQPLDSQGLKVR